MKNRLKKKIITKAKSTGSKKEPSPEKKKGIYSSKNILNDLTGTEWIQETTTIWYQRGLGQTHKHAQIEKEHPAPFPYSMVERLIKFFTKKDGLVLDPFCGVASTLKACALNERKGIGIELSQKWVNLSKKRLKEEVTDSSQQKIIKGDSRKVLGKLDKESIDFVVTSPPYWQILSKPADHKVTKERIEKNLDTKYSVSKDDLGNIENYDEFLKELKIICKKCFGLLKDGKYMVIVVSDFRHKSKYIPFHSDVSVMMEECGFDTKSMSILVQNAKKLFPYGYPYDFVPNIHHQFILIFKKPKKIKNKKNAKK
jgi:DNA modification methylase